MKICCLVFSVLALLSPAGHDASAQCPAPTRIRFYPAEGQAVRMLHGRFTGPLAVSLPCVKPGAVFRIARGGGTPTRTQGELMSGSVRLENSEVIAAVAYADGLACSPVVVGPHRIGGDQNGARLTRSFHIGNSLTDTVDGEGVVGG
jgi:hypothetical protein